METFIDVINLQKFILLINFFIKILKNESVNQKKQKVI